MMLPTHALAGMALVLPVAHTVPELGGVALLAGFLGGVWPDLDMYAGHRKTLHYPVYYPALAAGSLPVAAVVPTLATVATACFLLGAALHSLSDAVGGGLELRPWEARSDRAVYDHCHGRWIGPRRWVRYDGAPEDLLLSVALSVPLLAIVDSTLGGLVLASLAVAVGYTAVRRSLPILADRLLGGVLLPRLPDGLESRLPARYVDPVTHPSTSEGFEEG